MLNGAIWFPFSLIAQVLDAMSRSRWRSGRSLVIVNRRCRHPAIGFNRSFSLPTMHGGLCRPRLPTPEDGKLRVNLTGALAGILSLTQKDQRPRPEDEAHASQVEVVAGARNHRQLTLLV
jgi:hypothetical protein